MSPSVPSFDSCVDNKIIGQGTDGDQNFKYLWVGLESACGKSPCKRSTSSFRSPEGLKLGISTEVEKFKNRTMASAVGIFQPTTQPTIRVVLYGLRVVWQSPRSCKLSSRACGPRNHMKIVQSRGI